MNRDFVYSVSETRPKVRNAALSNSCGPLHELPTVVLPEARALLEVLDYRIALALFEQFFSQHHVWTEAAKHG